MSDLEQTNVVVELGDTERARLELLDEALETVKTEVPEEMEQVTLHLVPGRKPCYWVDIVSFVEMSRDKRTYRFLKDTRLGRVVLAESKNVETIADKVTHYLAQRIIEREKALESDHLLAKMTEAAAPQDPSEAPATKNESSGSGIWWFLFGIIVGIVGLVLYAWFMPTRF